MRHGHYNDAPMKLIVSHISAAEFWRKVYPADRAPMRNFTSYIFEPEEIAFSEKDIWPLVPSWITDDYLRSTQGVLHTLHLTKGKGRRTLSHQSHVFTGNIPPGSLFALNENVYVCSPEFTFLQLAQVLSLTQLIAYGYELCGTYAFDANAEREFRTRSKPLTTVARLDEFLKLAKLARGRKRALEAVRFVSENAASPMEATGDMFLSLPYRYGGYSLPQLQLNFPIPIPPQLKPLFPHDYCVVDFCYPKEKFAIEYLGVWDHSGKESLRRDRGRTLALRELGFEIVEVTSRQVWDLASFEIIAKRVSKVSGKRIRSEELGGTSARLKLRATLANWNASGGIPA